MQFQTPEEFELSANLQEQKRLTELWYLRMSGAAPWQPGERELMDQKFEAQNITIRGLQAHVAAQLFADLPQETA
jgi:hypothetical protein